MTPNSIYAIAAFLVVSAILIGATTELATAQSPYGNGNGSNNQNMNGSMNNGNGPMMNNRMMNNAMMKGGILLKGEIANVQTNSSGMATYIESGVFVIRASPDSNGTVHAQVIARFEMIKPDGTGAHTHMIYGFQMTNMTMEENGTVPVATGTATVTLAGNPVKDVPLTIKVFNHNVVGFWIGPDKISGHFGNGPVYGILSKPSRGILAEMTMMH